MQEWEERHIGEDGVPVRAAEQLHMLAVHETKRLQKQGAKVSQPILSRTAKSTLKAGQVVGILSVPNATLEILPKIDGCDQAIRRSLLRMIAVALNLPIAVSESASMAVQRQNLLEVFIQFFAEALLDIARRGLPHRYLSRRDDLSYLRGKLDIRHQLLHNATRSDRLACVYDELSVDTPLNRILSAAVCGCSKR